VYPTASETLKLSCYRIKRYETLASSIMNPDSVIRFIDTLAAKFGPCARQHTCTTAFSPRNQQFTEILALAKPIS